MQFGKQDFNSKVLYFGHRDGSVSRLDTRCSDDAMFASCPGWKNDIFGSATQIQQLSKDDNLLIVKGSFGSSRVYDERRLSNLAPTHGRYTSPAIFEMHLPHRLGVHKTKSARCTGLAIDPTENVAVAPLATNTTNILGLWDVASGTFLRALSLGSLSFCELSCQNTATLGYKMCSGGADKEPTISTEPFGLWFKTDAIDLTPEGGGIHHVCF